MIEISFWKLLIVFLVALIVLGPEKLPTFARYVGEFIRQVRKQINHMQKDLSSLTLEEKKELTSDEKKE